MDGVGGLAEYCEYRAKALSAVRSVLNFPF